MYSSPTAFRRANVRVFCAVVFLSCAGYYIGRLSTPARWPVPSDNGLEWKDSEAMRVTVTVQAPRATVTVAPKAEEVVVLNGPPTQAFHGVQFSPSAFEKPAESGSDNLRPDVQYITTWPGAGFTNDAMGFMNLIYLAMLTERVPIIPHFNPTHISRTSLDTDVVDPNFGEVFDVPRLSKDLRIPILEWWQVKGRKR
ncbi:hypothetical protein B0H14DRAFT_3471564 [Mycena olivaceomarginata]|nr:hypothetical protein B0H14DRAFT_3471564 [Mycena olivaceomarginata]